MQTPDRFQTPGSSLLVSSPGRPQLRQKDQFLFWFTMANEPANHARQIIPRKRAASASAIGHPICRRIDKRNEPQLSRAVQPFHTPECGRERLAIFAHGCKALGSTKGQVGWSPIEYRREIIAQPGVCATICLLPGIIVSFFVCGKQNLVLVREKKPGRSRCRGFRANTSGRSVVQDAVLLLRPYRWIRAEPPFITCITSSRVTMLVSPRVLCASAPCAAPISTHAW